MDTILNSIELETNNIDSGMVVREDSVVYMKLSPDDLDIRYNKILLKNIGNFSPSRSISKLKTAILYVFRKGCYHEIKEIYCPSSRWRSRIRHRRLRQQYTNE